MSNAVTLHATAVAINGSAILIRGKPGSGKSALALELMECPGNGLGAAPLRAELVADDQTLVSKEKGQLWCSCPPTLAGLLEVRGVGILAVKATGPVPLALVVDLLPPGESSRLPGDEEKEALLLGLAVPRLAFPSGAGALASRLRTAISRL
jgi:serine kinase of HPr protein (carbohydrate metabolism regulator)